MHGLWQTWLTSLLMLGAILISPSARAYRITDCVDKTIYSRGLYRKYDVKYSMAGFASFQTSAAEGSANVSSKSSEQTSSVDFDPGISTGVSSWSSQFSSSYGDCSALASNQKLMKRQVYVSENLEQIRRDIAKGGGEYSETVAYLSGCPATAKESFANLLRNHYDHLFGESREVTSLELGADIDSLLSTDLELKNLCEPSTHTIAAH